MTGAEESIAIDIERTAGRDHVVGKKMMTIIDRVNGIVAMTDIVVRTVTGETRDTGREVPTELQATDHVTNQSSENTTTIGGIARHLPVVAQAQSSANALHLMIGNQKKPEKLL